METTATVIEQSLTEIAHRWKKTPSGNATAEFVGMTEIISYLSSCGIDVLQEERYELLLSLRSAGYKEQVIDNQVSFTVYA